MEEILRRLEKKKEEHLEKMKETGQDFKKIKVLYKDLMDIKVWITGKVAGYLVGEDIESYVGNNTKVGILLERYHRFDKMIDELDHLEKQIDVVSRIIRNIDETLKKHKVSFP